MLKHFAPPGFRAVVPVTAAQLNALTSTPVTIIPAPGAGRLIVPSRAVLSTAVGTIAIGPFTPVPSYLFWESDLVAANLLAHDDEMFVGATSRSLVVDLGGEVTSRANKAVLLAGLDGDFSTYGGLNAVAKANGGTGYVVGDTGTIANANGGTLGTYQVLTVSAGAVLTLSITAVGNRYVTANGVATAATSGIGTGLTVNITSITPGNGTAQAIVYYDVVTV